MRKILLLVYHGIEFGRQSDYYFAPLSDGVRKYVNGNISIRGINWGKYVEEREMITYDRISKYQRPWVRWVTKLVCRLVLDLLYYFAVMKGKDRSELEEKILAETKTEIEIFRKNNPNGVVVLCGHSAGSEIALKLCYETELGIHGLITFGNFTEYISGIFPDWGQCPAIHFWHILHHRGDPISSTMQDNENFKNFVTVHDVSNWRNFIMAHTSYWESGDVHKKIAEILKNIP